MGLRVCMSLNRLFLATFSGFPEKVAFLFESRRVTFSEIKSMSGRIASSLRSSGLTRGDRVAVFLPSGIDLILAHLSIGFAGGVRVPLNPAYGEKELSHILKDSGTNLVFTNSDLKSRIDELGIKDLRVIITGEDIPGKDEYFDKESSDNDTAMIAYTSGTTGLSKGSMITHGNLRSNIQTLIQVWGWTEDETLLLTLPLFHIHGLGLGVHGVLTTGCTCILKPRFQAEEVLEILSRGEATLFMGVPTMYYRMAVVEDPGRFDLSRVRLFISGSAPLAPALFEKFKALYCHEILERYGLTETIMNTSNPLEGKRKPGSVGLPLPGIEVRVVGDYDVFLGPGREGEVVVKGPNVCKGYLNRPDANEDSFVKGYFRTGDLGYFDEDGYLHLVGRKSELIISGGYNVYPKEVEQILLTHPDVNEVAVAGREDPELGEKVWAFVVPKPGKSPEYSEVKSFLQGKVAGFKIPKGLTLISKLPRNAMGKVQRSKLKDSG